MRSVAILRMKTGRVCISRGRCPTGNFVSLLQLSTVHVYWTYPFVLSWSLIEAMSAGAAIVASDTAPLREVIQHGENGLLVDFFSVDSLVKSVCSLLDDPGQTRTLWRGSPCHSHCEI